MQEIPVWFLGRDDPLEKGRATHSGILGLPWWQMVKNPPAGWENWVQFLGWEDPLEKGRATHASILAWRIPWSVLSMGLQRVKHDWGTFTSPPWRPCFQLTAVWLLLSPPRPLSSPLAHYMASSLITGGQVGSWAGGQVDPDQELGFQSRGSREPEGSEQGSDVTKSYLKSPHSSEHTA